MAPHGVRKAENLSDFRIAASWPLLAVATAETVTVVGCKSTAALTSWQCVCQFRGVCLASDPVRAGQIRGSNRLLCTVVSYRVPSSWQEPALFAQYGERNFRTSRFT